MNKAQILALMMRRNQPSGDISLFNISDLMADAIASISDRLSEDELYIFISIGAAIYGYGSQQLTQSKGDDSLLQGDEDYSFPDEADYPPMSRRRH